MHNGVTSQLPKQGAPIGVSRCMVVLPRQRSAVSIAETPSARPPANPLRPFGRTLTGLPLTILLLFLTGCATTPDPPRRDLTELYLDALNQARQTPDHQLGIHRRANPISPVTAAEPDDEQLQAVESVPPPVDDGVLVVLPENAAASRSAAAPRWQGTQKLNTNRSPLQTVSHSVHSPVKAATVTVTDVFQDTDLRQALQSLMDQTEATIILDEQAGGIVNGVFDDVPLEAALRRMLLPLGLIWKQSGPGEYLIGRPDPTSAVFPLLADRHDFHPRHLSPAELTEMLTERDRKYVTPLDKRNLVVVEAPDEEADRLLARLSAYDRPVPQVELEAIVCVIAPDGGFRSGLDWGHAVTLNGSDIFRLGMAGLALSGQASPTGLSNSFSDFALTSAFVRLLAQEGYLSIRAAPRVTARDGDQATISITRESFFSTQPLNSDVFFRQEIEQVDAGIMLDITPTIRGDQITVRIEKAEVSEDIRTTNVTTNIADNPFPQINRRTVSTTVHVGDGETIVIGGLVQRQTVDRIARIPILGSLPWIGGAFRTVEQTQQDAEVVIFISPRIIEPGCAPLSL